MAQKKAIKLAKVDDIDKLYDAVKKYGDAAVQDMNQVVGLANSMNKPFSSARQNGRTMNQQIEQLYRVVEVLDSQFKELGIETPQEVRANIARVEKLKREYQKQLLDSVAKMKSAIPDRL